MTVFNCQETLDRVFYYIDAELSEEERTKVDQHLTNCEACTREYAVETRISSMIVSSDLAPISTQDLVDKALSKYRLEQEES
jgi:mycothiol system anti-sigma-R factor